MMATVEIQTIGSYAAAWGEGPIWWKDVLFYVDIEGHRLVRLVPGTGEETTWELGERIGTVVPTDDGRLLLAGDSGIFQFDPGTGERFPLADPEADKRGDNRFNDGKCDPAGRFWAGTISTVKRPGDAALYMLDAKGALHRKLDAVTNSNGLCWSGDARTFYYIDTPTRTIRAFDFDNATGSISNGEVLIDTEKAGFDSSPDGMTIDVEGRLFVAFCHGGCVACFDPATASLVDRIELPVVETTACAFGGRYLERLFVTTGKKQDLDEADAGRLFVVDGLETRGVPAFAYRTSAV